MKDGKLTAEEYDTIKLHPVIGANIFSSTDIFKHLAPIILCHHERIDGNGYPNKLQGKDISYFAKILAICDSFDAIVSKRPYKDKMPLEYGIDQLKQGANTQFDKDLVNFFVKFIKQNREEIDNIYE